MADEGGGEGGEDGDEGGKGGLGGGGGEAGGNGGGGDGGRCFGQGVYELTAHTDDVTAIPHLTRNLRP